MTIRQYLESIYTSECPMSVLQLLKKLIEAMDNYAATPIEAITISKGSGEGEYILTFELEGGSSQSMSFTAPEGPEGPQGERGIGISNITIQAIS